MKFAIVGNGSKYLGTTMPLQLELPKNYNFQMTHVCDPNADMYECWNVLSCREKQEKNNWDTKPYRRHFKANAVQTDKYYHTSYIIYLKQQ